MPTSMMGEDYFDDISEYFAAMTKDKDIWEEKYKEAIDERHTEKKKYDVLCPH